MASLPQLSPTAGDEGQANQNPPAFDAQIMMPWMKWSLLVLGVYFAVASAALQALQTKGPLPTSSQLVCVALVLSLIAVLFSIHTFQNHKFSSLVFIHVGIFFGAAALVVALVRDMNPPLMGTMIAIYVSAIFIIIVASVSKLARYKFPNLS